MHSFLPRPQCYLNWKLDGESGMENKYEEDGEDVEPEKDRARDDCRKLREVSIEKGRALTRIGHEIWLRVFNSRGGGATQCFGSCLRPRNQGRLNLRDGHCTYPGLDDQKVGGSRTGRG